jgi:uncharacterized protein
MADRLSLPPAVTLAAADLKRALTAELGARLRDVRVFGSVARGEADEHSDVDLLVVLDEIHDHRDRTSIYEAASDVGLHHDLPIQALVLSEAELRLLRQRETSIATAVDSEGVSI